MPGCDTEWWSNSLADLLLAGHDILPGTVAAPRDQACAGGHGQCGRHGEAGHDHGALCPRRREHRTGAGEAMHMIIASWVYEKSVNARGIIIGGRGCSVSISLGRF